MATFFFSGTFQSLFETIINPYSGDIYVINDTYLVNDGTYVGSISENDVLAMTNNQEVLFLLDSGGTPVLESIETVAGSGGNDIFNLASTTHFLGDMLIGAGAGDDLVWANVGNDTLSGGNGNDILHGGPGNDVILGDADNDILIGGTGDDTLDGGTGDDVMDGGEGADTYVAGIGNDTIIEASAADTNVIELPAGIVLSDLSFNINGNDLEITVGVSGLITISGQFDAADSGIDTLVFSDSSTFDLRTITPPPAGPTEGDDVLDGTSGDDVIDALGGDDIINGLEGDDTLIGGAGADTLNGGDGNDTADYTTATSSVSVDLYSGQGLDGDADGDTYDSIENITGSDLVSEGDFIIADNNDNHLRGLAGDDIFEGLDGADTIDGGDGNDTAHYWNSYEGVQIDLQAGIAAGGHAEGDVLTSVENLIGSAYNDILTGDAQSNNLRGFDGNDAIYGGGGNDTLNGGEGDDVMSGGAGSDTYVAGVGDDTIIEASSAETNKIIMPPGVTIGDLGFSAVGNDLQIFLGATGSITILGQYDAPDSGIDTLRFSNGFVFDLRSVPRGPTEGDDVLDGTSGDDTLSALGGNDIVNGLEGNDILGGDAGDDVLNGGAGNDALDGGDGDDTLDGGDGDDVMTGGAGSDTYVAGVGNDTIIEASSAETNVIELPAGIVESDLSYGFNGNDLIITVGVAGEITIVGQYDAPDSGIDTLVFSDSSTFDLRTVVPPPSGGPSESDDVLNGTAGDDVIDGLGGNDAVSGGDGDDVLSGGLGADLVSGGDGDDTLLYVADDVWPFGYVAHNVGSPDASGSGVETKLIGKGRSYDLFDGGAGFDTLMLTDGDDVIFLDDSFSERYGGGSSGARLESIEKIVAGDGHDIVDLTSPDYALGNVILEGGNGNDYLWSSSGDDILIAGDGSDQLFGGSGNDVLFGNAGGDKLEGGDGDDYLSGENGSDRMYGGAGNDTLIGGNGSDKFYGGDGDDLMIVGVGYDRIYADSGKETIAFDAMDVKTDLIYDFDESEDVINITDVLEGYDAGVDPISDFVQFVQDSGDTVIQVNADGDAGGDFTALARVYGGLSGSVEDLVSSGTLVLDQSALV